MTRQRFENVDESNATNFRWSFLSKFILVNEDLTYEVSIFHIYNLLIVINLVEKQFLMHYQDLHMFL